MGLLKKILLSIFLPTRDNIAASRGAFNEAIYSLGLKAALPSEYRVLENITIPNQFGTSQIDVIVVSIYGIHVIEMKAIQGAIYGDEKAKNWAVYLGKRKFPLRNPLHQNYGHIKALQGLLGLEEGVFHSVVFFTAENCWFKTRLPPNVMKSGYARFIQSNREVVFTPEEASEICRKIELHSFRKSDQTERAHIERTKARYHTQHHIGDPCPKCGLGKLVRRESKKTGECFLGCSNYPKCKYTQSV